MSRALGNSLFRTTVTISCALLLPYVNSVALADTFGAPPPGYPAPVQQAMPQGAPQQQAMAPEQLDNLVAPIALYPDPLLGQILAASTYPLEIMEAQQWLQQNRNLQGPQLMEAAKQQDWDPSVQVLVGFPDAMALMTRDIRWTTDLGNAFLSQQSDVMGAIQTMRAQASSNGRLATTPQQVVTTERQDGQTAIAIQPANPQVIYVPVYDPAYVWGAPAYGAYPAMSYGYGYGGSGYGGGFGFGSGINIAGLFTTLLGFTHWGWALGWFTHSLSLIGAFFNLLGFHGGYSGGYGYGGYGSPALWAHNPIHRLGVPYASAGLAARFGGGYSGVNAAGRMGSVRSAGPQGVGSARPAAGNSWQRFSGPTSERSAGAGVATSRAGFAPYQTASAPRAASQGFAPQQRYTAPMQTQRYSTPYSASAQTQQRYSAPRQNNSASRNSGPQVSARVETSHYSAPKYSAPRFSAPRAPKFSAPKAPKNSGGGHSSGKSSHKH